MTAPETASTVTTQAVQEAPVAEVTAVASGTTAEQAPEATVTRANSNSALRAFFPDVVDATGVALVPSDKEEEEETERRSRLVLWIGGSVCLVLALAIILPLTLLSRNDAPEVVLLSTPRPRPSMAPSMPPSWTPTAEPIPEHVAQTVEFLRQETNTLVLENEEWWNNASSAPYRAAQWLSQEQQKLFDTQDDTILQRFALATLYYATSRDPGWKPCAPDFHSGCPGEPWLSPGSECEWGFVTCQDNKWVTELNFRPRGNEMRGTLPPQLSLLSRLQVFSIPNNHLTGGIANSLHTIDDTTTLLHSIDRAFYGVSSLKALTLFDNDFSGAIPTRIWTTNTNLRIITLNENRFTGTIPDELFGLNNLVDLQLQSNQLTGPIPDSLRLLNATLKRIELNDNKLEGSLPSSLYALTALTSLDVSINTLLTGNFNVDNRITQLSNLREFDAAFTQLTGTLPEHLFSSLTAMETWNVQGSSFGGTLSEKLALWNTTLGKLWLQDNQFTGALPTAFDALLNLEELRLEGNSFTGTISPTLCASRGDGFQELATLTVDCAVDCACCDLYDKNCP